MTFIKLSNIIINSTKISTIRISKNKYFIDIVNSNLDGFMILGAGSITNIYNNIEVCKETNIVDYNIVENWINKKTKNNF
jgi:hypothetical protein